MHGCAVIAVQMVWSRLGSGLSEFVCAVHARVHTAGDGWNPEQQRVGRRQNIDNRLWIYVSFSATRATGKLTIYKLCDSNHLNWTCTSIVCITQTLLSAALLAPPAGCWAADRAQQKEGETRRRRTTHSSSDMEKGIGTSGTRTERDQETRTNKPFRNTRARAQIVHVKPPPDTPSSFEATDVYIPGPETSVPDPDRTVGRGQKVSLRRVPVYMQRPSAKNGAHDGQRAPAVRPITPPETDVTAVPGTADATRPI
ncbi:hypothetical protein Bbelb_191090 [Branchiostoma belcheri]|nr:hypothetical protein Bbelb_191090 [Branchiostoma belcheri]